MHASGPARTSAYPIEMDLTCILVLSGIPVVHLSMARVMADPGALILGTFKRLKVRLAGPQTNFSRASLVCSNFARIVCQQETESPSFFSSRQARIDCNPFTVPFIERHPAALLQTGGLNDFHSSDPCQLKQTVIVQFAS